MSTFTTARRALPHARAALEEILADAESSYADRFQKILDIDPRVRYHLRTESVEDEEFTNVGTFISHEKVPDCYLLGIYLYCGYRPREKVAPVVRELNGCYIDTSAPVWRICAYPPPSLRHASEHCRDAASDSVPPPEMRRAVTRVDDGVRITVGWVQGELKLFTTRGYFMNDKNYFGEVSFEHALEEALEVHGASLADLQADRSYTFVLHDGRYQPFERDVTRLTLIETTFTEGPFEGIAVSRLRSEEELADDAVEFSPLATPELLEEIAQDPVVAAVPGQTCVNRFAPESELWAAVRRTKANADTVAALRAGSDPILYGYLVTRASEQGPSAAVLLESPLLAQIRRLAYDELPLDREVRPSDRLYLHALDAHLRGHDADFLLYFPQHEDWISDFQQIFDEVVGALERALIQASAHDPEELCILYAQSQTSGVSAIIQALLTQILESAETRAEFSPGQNFAWKCRQFVIQPAHLDLCARQLIPSLQ